MADLTTLFKERDAQYTKETLKIFKLIDATLGCVTAFLIDTDESVAQGITSWEDASIIDDMVVIIGMVDYEIGSIVTLAETDFRITNENLENFQRVVHMSVPLDLADEGDSDKLMQYLYDISDDKDIDDFSNVITPAPAMREDDFDLSELSEEQLQALKHTTAKGGQ